jgi:alkyl hydroperoxide reductase subunit AhpC
MTVIGFAAPRLAADAYVRGESTPPRCLDLEDYRGTWTVVAYGARATDLRELAALEDAFEADGAVVLATTSADHADVRDLVEGDPALAGVRFPILTMVAETRRITLVVDPGGVVRWVGLNRTARETLTALERARLVPALRIAA